MTEVAKHKAQRSDASNTPKCRGAYPYLFKKREKRANGGALKSPRYDMTLLVPKIAADPAQCPNYAYLAKHCMDAAAKAWPGAGWPAGGHWPIQDGDVPVKPKAPVPGAPVLTAEQIAEKYKWRRGNWIIEVTSGLDIGPKVAVMQNGQISEVPAQDVLGKRMFKSGDYCIASIHAYTFQNEKFGCNFGFEGVLWVGEGELIGSAGGQRSTAEMFAGVGTMAPPTGPSGTHPTPPPATGPAGTYPPAPPAMPPQYAPPVAPGMPPAPPAPPTAPAAPGLPPFPPAR